MDGTDDRSQVVIASKKISVLLADDHTVLRRGLRRLLEEESDIEVVAEAGDGREAVRKAVELKPDVILLDVSMPGLTGIQVARRLRTQVPDSKIVILTVHEVESYVRDALKAGVMGYLIKDAAPEELADAIRVVGDGGLYLSRSVERFVLERPTADGAVVTVSDQLTKREREVCRMLALGHTVPEIAEIIGISRKTVDVHKTRLMRKLDVHNRADLVRYALQNGVINA